MSKKTNNKLNKIWFYIARGICEIFYRTLLRLEFKNIENVPADGGFLMISNHQSFLDPVLCGIALKRHLHFLARDSLFKNPLLGKLISSVNTTPVKRGTADLGAMKTVITKLKQGRGVCLFPEGTRSIDGKIAALKPGLGLLCRRGKAAIVPVTIDGAFECWPKHKKFFRIGAKIVISYGKCITVEELKNIDDRELAARLTTTLRQMQTQIRTENNKQPYDYAE